MLPKVFFWTGPLQVPKIFYDPFLRCSGETPKRLEALLWTNFQYCLATKPLTFLESRRKMMFLCK